MNQEPVRPSKVMASPSSRSSSARAATKLGGAAATLDSSLANRRRVAPTRQSVDLNQEREAHGQRRMAHSKGQRGAVGKAQAGAAVEREICPITVPLVFEVEGTSGLTEDRPMLTEPEVP